MKKLLETRAGLCEGEEGGTVEVTQIARDLMKEA